MTTQRADKHIPLALHQREQSIHRVQKTRREASCQTAVIAGNVVVGPAIRNAKPAAGFIPWVNKPPIIGNVARLLVYTGTPRRAANGMENGLL